MVTELNKNFSKSESIVFIAGQGGLPKGILRHASGAEAEFYLFGANISSWCMPKHGQLLFMSPKADFSGTKPLRGGIPLVFPQFGSGKLPSHGFARINPWSVKSTAVSSGGDVEVVLALSANDALRAMWPFEFEAQLQIILGANLKTVFTVKNFGTKDFAFNNALHTYFTVSDVQNVKLHGFKGLAYLDSLKNRAREMESRDILTFNCETDRIYVDAPGTLRIEDTGNKRTMNIEKNGMNDAVVWNPWIERCKAIGDLESDSYRKFVCVESCNAAASVTVGAGKTFSCSQVLRVS